MTAEHTKQAMSNKKELDGEIKGDGSNTRRT